MSIPYKVRLARNEYQDDVQCEIRLQPDPRDERTEPIMSSISERLLGRLRHLGQAYELPLLARLPDTGSISYPEVQLGALEDELAFLFSVLTDNMLLEALAPVREMIQRAEHDPRGWLLMVQAP